MAEVAIDDSLFTWPTASPRLHGSRCSTSGVTVELEPTGTLWSWTIQGFPPKSPPYAKVETPATFEPYGVGYVELAGQVKVESRLTVADPDRLEIGMPMELTIVPFMENEAGDTVMTFAFAPTGEG